MQPSPVSERIYRYLLGLRLVRWLRKQIFPVEAVVCRKAIGADADAILDLLTNEAHVEGLTAERIAGMILSGEEYVYVAEYQGKLVGHVCAGQYWMEPYGIAGWVVMRLIVTRPRRGWGIGERLLGCLLADLALVDHERIMLTVHRKNRPAIALYRKLGFDQAGHIPEVFRSAGHLGMELAAVRAHE